MNNQYTLFELAKSIEKKYSHDGFFIYHDGNHLHLALGVKRSFFLDHQTKSDPFSQIEQWCLKLNTDEYAFGYLSFEACCGIINEYPEYLHNDAIFFVPKEHYILDNFEKMYLESLLSESPLLISLQESMTQNKRTLSESQVENVLLNHKNEYISSARHAINDMELNSLEKMILSRKVPVNEDVDFTESFVNGYLNSIWNRSFYMTLGDVQSFGFSPEILFNSDSTGHISTNPLAGTRRRGRNEKHDQEMAQELRDSAKEVKEHAMSVLLAQQELARVCKPDSISITEFMEIKKYSSVQHLSSRVNGELSPSRSIWDAMREIAPGVTVSGINKEEAIRCILDLETQQRGIYSGAVGFVKGDGKSDFTLPIRSVFKYLNQSYVQAGAGLIPESNPQEEFLETSNKLKSTLNYLCINKKCAEEM